MQYVRQAIGEACMKHEWMRWCELDERGFLRMINDQILNRCVCAMCEYTEMRRYPEVVNGT